MKNTPVNKIHTVLPIQNRKHIVIALITIAFLIFGSFGSALAYSTKLKIDADKEYKNKNYVFALSQYEEAQKWWFLEKISFKLRDRDLHTKIQNAGIMVRSAENYDKGIKAFIYKDYVGAVSSLTKVIETDPHYKETQNALSQIIENTKPSPTPIPNNNANNQNQTVIQPSNVVPTTFDWEKWSKDLQNTIDKAKNTNSNSAPFPTIYPSQNITVVNPTPDNQYTVIPEADNALSQLRDTLTTIKNSPIAMDVMIGKCTKAKDEWQDQYWTVYMKITQSSYYESQFKQIIRICP